LGHLSLSSEIYEPTNLNEIELEVLCNAINLKDAKNPLHNFHKLSIDKMKNKGGEDNKPTSPKISSIVACSLTKFKTSYALF
jgi:hypothetical protein